MEEFDTIRNTFSAEEVTIGSGKKVWWICPNGHSYQTSLPNRIKMNTGCGVCSHKVFLKGYNDLETTHPEIAKEFDSEKNELSPNQVMAGSNNKKYWFRCPRGHSYQATLLNRKKGRNCPICVKEMHHSFPEKAIVFYLNQAGLDIKQNYLHPKMKRMEIDVFVSELSVGIEYDGRAWHKDCERDIKKDKLCDENGIKLIRVREKGCCEYNSSAYIITIEPNNIHELEIAIKKILLRIVSQKNIDINIERDRSSIYSLLELNEKQNSMYDIFPEIMEFWDDSMNGGLNPRQLSKSSIKKIHLKCANNHTWVSVARDFEKSRKCPICSGYKILAGYNDLATTHPNLKEAWSPKNTVDITHFSYGSQYRAIWYCNRCGGEYTLRIADRVKRKTDCPYCQKKKEYR